MGVKIKIMLDNKELLTIEQCHKAIQYSPTKNLWAYFLEIVSLNLWLYNNPTPFISITPDQLAEKIKSHYDISGLRAWLEYSILKNMDESIKIEYNRASGKITILP